ncbi:MAG: tetratricopeptide repeat protein [Candidatus Thiodiazotropha lotti]|uniref:Tetratricopeptide repeat protein n=1 Tax=Candidatus Thiodiazotropha lotti TaxID=2792787 RepID=A0A9E4N0Y7_9GAMM|nr:tetratricopeptide repeat protein [Candidatus Thiodiazotropha lotti]MCG7923454.1 tetratricopeptide repeat protein [Candidatus Thiodiazotropha lotti]MCG7939753.1 tetratricopeptide repeat protein [Candidatus Thiodiazotropha lotti]MCG8005173.1 tetratricopeptide repeat protein [Candidatus Thiodiazotropha lotti]MCG8006992.1 tetratricopeptide repeat protein [Candidatus Thiodiazotropha lotti]
MSHGLIPRLLLTISLALPITASAEIKPGEPQELRDLHYGEALFQLYQEAYFPAIVRLLSARKQGLMQNYADEPELLLGGLYLAYGMPDTAEHLFNRVLKTSATPEIQNKAWLQLGKSRFRRGEDPAAAKALSQIGAEQPTDAKDEKQHLEGLIALKRNKPTDAVESLTEISGDSEWSLYGDFNRALALLQSDQSSSALEILKTIGDGHSEQDNEELKAIRDRANLTRGYLLLEAEQPQPAKDSLQKVRLKGASSNQALLGLGWASLQQGKEQQALAPWQLLAGRNPSDPAVLEAKLAIPYVLAQLKAEQQSLDAYQNAITTYDQTLGSVDQIIQQINQGGFPDSLMVENQEDKQKLHTLLPFLLTGNSFQERLQDYRDLQELENNLQEWQTKITAYLTMLDNQQQTYKEQLPRVEAFLRGDKLKQLQEQHAELDAHYNIAVSEEEPAFILATGEEKTLIERMQRIESLINESASPEQFQVQKEIAQLMEGILIWRTVTEHPARVWNLKKQMKALTQNIESVKVQQTELAASREQSENRFGDLSARIDSLQERIPELLEQVTVLRKQQAKHLQEMALARLEQRKTLVNNYLIQARFGVASLLDISTDRGVQQQ